MLYTVYYTRDDEEEAHHNLTKMEADLLASYIRKKFRKEVEVVLQEKLYHNTETE